MKNKVQYASMIEWIHLIHAHKCFHLLSSNLRLETRMNSKIHCEEWLYLFHCMLHERKAIENTKEVLFDSISLLWWWVYYHWALFIIVRPIRHLCYALHIEFGNLGHNNLSGVVRVKFQKRRQGGAENGKRPLFASCVSDFCCGISFLSAKSWKWLTEG